MIPTKNFLKALHFMKSEDAVAEVLDFVTIVGILMLSFSLIGLVGYPALKNAQEARYIENTKQSFVVLADNINKVATGQAPSHGGVIKMYGGTLSVTGGSTIQVNMTVYNSTSNSIEEKYVLEQMRSIENSIGDTKVVYEGTGVWVKYPTGYVLNAYKPLITNRSDILIIPVIYINGFPAKSGTDMSKITVCQQEIPSEEGGCGQPSITYWSNVSNVTVIITGDYNSGWKDYFNGTMKWSTSADGTYTARLNDTRNLDVYILKSQLYTEIT
ncbi:DUF7289 family protein [Candidatus Methanoperedens nitratireducens]|nr:hypothetical protein [Candidatus Methanoperedens nitroreducens]